ncbi:hypothetical protein J6590_089275, partial [Homalodisca vitripennis]
EVARFSMKAYFPIGQSVIAMQLSSSLLIPPMYHVSDRQSFTKKFFTCVCASDAFVLFSDEAHFDLIG